jgi:hypothetical protein
MVEATENIYAIYNLGYILFKTLKRVRGSALQLHKFVKNLILVPASEHGYFVVS